MATEPAFTQVAARRTLVKEPAAAPSGEAGQFPPSVVEYVQRAFFQFNRLKDGPACARITDKDIRKKLSDLVNEARKEGTVNTRDWSSYPLPHELLLEEQEQHILEARARQQAALQNLQNAVTANLNLTSGAAHESPSSGSASKKRKSHDQEMADEADRAVTPPWKRKNTKSIADRISVQSKKQEKKQKGNGKAHGWFDNSEAALERRRQRFGQLSPEPSPSSRSISPVTDANAGPIVGTCEILEKNYFRLTAPPNPNTVRPLSVLERALEHVIARWKDTKDYTYVCDQLKSIRQDLTVQRIKNQFSIRVYEVHARIALEKKDLGEYNQCQTQLRALYKLKLGEDGGSGGKQDEFTAYRILYLIYTRNRTDMNNMLADLTTADKKGPFVRLALKVREALASGNYHRFFKLYNEAQDWNMAPFLMDMFIERERLGAMAAMSKAYVERNDRDGAFADLYQVQTRRFWQVSRAGAWVRHRQ
jgi:hypothetical protein